MYNKDAKVGGYYKYEHAGKHILFHTTHYDGRELIAVVINEMGYADSYPAGHIFSVHNWDWARTKEYNYIKVCDCEWQRHPLYCKCPKQKD